MFIFLRLLLAHLVGDFALQFGKIYDLKYKGLKGILPHSFIVTGAFILFCWPYLKLPGLWVFIFILGVTHLLQDWIKIVWIKGPKEKFWPYLFDQFFHVSIIAVVFLTPLKDLKPAQYNIGAISAIYNNDTFVIYLIFLIAATYNGAYLIEAFKNTFLKLEYKHTSFEKWYGIIERAVAVSIFISGGILIIIVPFIFCVRILLSKMAEEPKLNLGISKQLGSSLEIILSAAFTLIFGVGLSVST